MSDLKKVVRTADSAYKLWEKAKNLGADVGEGQSEKRREGIDILTDLLAWPEWGTSNSGLSDSLRFNLQSYLIQYTFEMKNYKEMESMARFYLRQAEEQMVKHNTGEDMCIPLLRRRKFRREVANGLELQYNDYIGKRGEEKSKAEPAKKPKQVDRLVEEAISLLKTNLQEECTDENERIADQEILSKCYADLGKYGKAIEATTSVLKWKTKRDKTATHTLAKDTLAKDSPNIVDTLETQYSLATYEFYYAEEAKSSDPKRSQKYYNNAKRHYSSLIKSIGKLPPGEDRDGLTDVLEDSESQRGIISSELKSLESSEVQNVEQPETILQKTEDVDPKALKKSYPTKGASAVPIQSTALLGKTTSIDSEGSLGITNNALGSGLQGHSDAKTLPPKSPNPKPRRPKSPLPPEAPVLGQKPSVATQNSQSEAKGGKDPSAIDFRVEAKEGQTGVIPEEKINTKISTSEASNTAKSHSQPGQELAKAEVGKVSPRRDKTAKSQTAVTSSKKSKTIYLAGGEIGTEVLKTPSPSDKPSTLSPGASGTLLGTGNTYTVENEPVKKRARRHSLGPQDGGKEKEKTVIGVGGKIVSPALEDLNLSTEPLSSGARIQLGISPTARVESENAILESDENHVRIGAGLFNSISGARSESEIDQSAFDWIEQFKLFKKKLVEHSGSCKAVKVAILDTGLDYDHPYIYHHWARPLLGKDDCDIEDEGWKDFLDDSQLEPLDEDGHGTHVAGILLQYSPQAQVYIARIARSGDSISHDKQLPDRVAKAINHAADVWGVDIISMSFGFRWRFVTEEDREQYRRLNNSINRADGNNIIMLAAASNNGNLTSVPFPASDSRVIPVGACRGLGRPAEFTPSPWKGKNFCILGVDILSTWPSFNTVQDQRKREKLLRGSFVRKSKNEEGQNSTENQVPGNWKCLSGTSFATPLAAALTVLLLHYYRKNIEPRNPHPAAQTRRGIEEIFTDMSRDDLRDGYDYIVPWTGHRNKLEKYDTDLKAVMDRLFDIHL